MNEEHKAIAEEIFYLRDHGHTTPVEAFNAMAALLQELIDAPEPEPVAYQVRNGWVNIALYERQIDAENYAKDQQKRHDLSGSIAHFCVVPLYTSPPANNQSEQHLEMVNAPEQSVTDEQLQAAFDRGLKAGNEQSVAQQIEIHKLHDSLAAPQPPALSDERIFKLFLEKAVDRGTAGIYDFARAIEREILGQLE